MYTALNLKQRKTRAIKCYNFVVRGRGSLRDYEWKSAKMEYDQSDESLENGIFECFKRIF